MIENGAPSPRQRTTQHWRKSSYSGTAGNCIEVTNLDREIWALRDSKHPAGPVLTFPADEWAAFTSTVKSPRTDPVSRKHRTRSD
jgi:hypothetical protein